MSPWHLASPLQSSSISPPRLPGHQQKHVTASAHSTSHVPGFYAPRTTTYTGRLCPSSLCSCPRVPLAPLLRPSEGHTQKKRECLLPPAPWDARAARLAGWLDDSAPSSPLRG